MDDIKLKAFDQDVVASGSLITSTDKPAVLIIDPDDHNDNKLEIEFVFIDDNTKQQSTQLGGDHHKLSVRLINHANPLGTSFKKPIEVASNKTSVLSLMIVTHAVQAMRVVNYQLLSRMRK